MLLVRDVASKVTLAGGVSFGGVLLTTVIFCVALAVFPPASTAVQVTIVVPSGNPWEGELLVSEAIPMLSVAVA